MGGPHQQYRGINYPASYPPSSGNMELHQAGLFAGGPGPVSGDPGGMQSASAGRAGSTTSEDQIPPVARSGDTRSMNTGSDGGRDSGVSAPVEGNSHLRSAGPPSADDNLGRPQMGMDSRPGYPLGTDGANLRYGQPGVDVRGVQQKQMFGQMPSRSTPFMNMNGVAIRPGQFLFGPEGAQGRGVDGMGPGPQTGEMDSASSRPDQPVIGPDGSQRRPGQSMQADGLFGRQGPPGFGMNGSSGRLGPPSGMDPMMRRTGHPLPDDGTMSRSAPSANMDGRPPMHGMPVRGDESSDDGYRQGPANMPIRPGMESMPGRPLPQMGGMVEAMSVRPMPPQQPGLGGGMDMMPGRSQMRIDAMERRAGMPEGMGPHSQHPSYGHQYPGYGSHAPSGHPGHGPPPPGGFTTSDANAPGEQQMFRNHVMPASHGIHADRGPAAPCSSSDVYQPGSEYDQHRHFMSNGDVDLVRRSGDPSFAPKNIETGEYGLCQTIETIYVADC